METITATHLTIEEVAHLFNEALRGEFVRRAQLGQTVVVNDNGVPTVVSAKAALAEIEKRLQMA